MEYMWGPLIIICTIVIFLAIKGNSNRKEKRNKLNREMNADVAMKKEIDKYFAELGDVVYRELAEKSPLSPIGNSYTFVIRVNVNGKEQLVLKPEVKYCFYMPGTNTIITEGKRGREVEPTFYKFRFVREDSGFWDEIVILVVPRNNIKTFEGREEIR